MGRRQSLEGRNSSQKSVFSIANNFLSRTVLILVTLCQFKIKKKKIGNERKWRLEKVKPDINTMA